jgi:hypothetical protein
VQQSRYRHHPRLGPCMWATVAMGVTAPGCRCRSGEDIYELPYTIFTVQAQCLR